MVQDTRPYRDNVGAALFNSAGQVFVGRRNGLDPASPHCWQLPQGGIDPGETPLQAVLRELLEEVGTASVELLGEHDEWLTYDLPAGIAQSAFGGKFRGQRQRWFALRFIGPDTDIQLDLHAEPEFAAWRWADLAELPGLAVPFKRPVYEVVAREFARFASVSAELRT